MQSRARLAGHPIHQMLIPLPLGLFIFAAVADILYGFGWLRGLSAVSFWNIVVGVATGLLAAVFGLWDFLAIPRDTRAKHIGLVHGMGNVLLVAIFALSAWARSDNPGFAPGTVSVLLEAGGLLLGVVTGWLGGELVDRLGVGVDEGAHLNAPSSLTSKPARIVR